MELGSVAAMGMMVFVVGLWDFLQLLRCLVLRILYGCFSGINCLGELCVLDEHVGWEFGI